MGRAGDTGVVGNQVQEGVGGARPALLPTVCCGSLDSGLGSPGLTARAGEIKAGEAGSFGLSLCKGSHLCNKDSY